MTTLFSAIIAPTKREVEHVSNWDFGPEVKSFYELACEGCGILRAVADKSQVFQAATEDHLEDCLRPARVYIAKRGELAFRESFRWEILLEDGTVGQKPARQWRGLTPW